MRQLVVYASDCRNTWEGDVVATPNDSEIGLGFAFLTCSLTDDFRDQDIPALVVRLLEKVDDGSDSVWCGESWIYPDRTPVGKDQLLKQMLVDFAIETKQEFWWCSDEDLLMTRVIEARCKKLTPPVSLITEMTMRRGLLWLDDLVQS